MAHALTQEASPDPAPWMLVVWPPEETVADMEELVGEAVEKAVLEACSRGERQAEKSLERKGPLP